MSEFANSLAVARKLRDKFAAARERNIGLMDRLSKDWADSFLEMTALKLYCDDTIDESPISVPPRKDVHPSIYIPSFREVLTPRPAFNLEEIARRLKLTPRDVRRKLTRLSQNGLIPNSWRVGKRWNPPVDDAVNAIQSAITIRRKNYTRESDDGDAPGYEKCKNRHAALKRELQRLSHRIELVNKWGKVFCDLPYETEHARLSDYIIALKQCQKRADSILDRIVDLEDWWFAEAVILIWPFVRSGCQRVIRNAQKASGLSHAKFYRTFSRQTLRKARNLAARLHTNPEWLVGPKSASLHESGDVASAFDCDDKVPEESRWIE